MNRYRNQILEQCQTQSEYYVLDRDKRKNEPITSPPKCISAVVDLGFLVGWWFSLEQDSKLKRHAPLIPELDENGINAIPVSFVTESAST
jgi:hypothetical protein